MLHERVRQLCLARLRGRARQVCLKYVFLMVLSKIRHQRQPVTLYLLLAPLTEVGSGLQRIFFYIYSLCNFFATPFLFVLAYYFVLYISPFHAQIYINR